MNEIAKCSIVGSLVPLPVSEVICSVEMHVSMAFVSLRIKYVNTTSVSCDCLFECGMSRGRATATACDVLLTDLVGNVVKAFTTAVIDPSTVNHNTNTQMQQAMGQGPSASPSYDPDVFRMPIVGVGAGICCEVHMQYIQPLRFWEGSYSIDVPLFINGDVMASKSIAEIVKINCTINTCTPESTWGSSSHRMNVLFSSPTHFVLTSDPGAMINANFNISYKAWSQDILGTCLIEPAEAKKKGSFVLFISPPQMVAPAAQAFSRKFVFLLDRSGSMAGSPMAIAKQALARALQQLNPDDRFAVCAFDHEMWWLDAQCFRVYSNSESDSSPMMFPATQSNISMAQQALEGIDARGGTDILTPVQATLTILNRDQPRDISNLMDNKTLSTSIMFLITDGAVSNEQQICLHMRDHGTGTRAFTLAIGPYANRYFLKMLATIGHGYSDVSLYIEELAEQIQSLMKKSFCPLLKDVTMGIANIPTHFGGVGLKDLEIYPNPPPDLYIGAPVCLSGTFYGAFPASVTIKGMDANGFVRELQISVALAEGIPVQKVFAQQHVEYLTAAYWLTSNNADRDRAKGKVVEVAIANSVPSPFTQTIAYEVKYAEPVSPAHAAPVAASNKGYERNQSVLAQNRRGWEAGLAVGGAVVLGTVLTMEFAFGSVSATSANALIQSISDGGILLFDQAQFGIQGLDFNCCCFDLGNNLDCGCGNMFGGCQLPDFGCNLCDNWGPWSCNLPSCNLGCNICNDFGQCSCNLPDCNLDECGQTIGNCGIPDCNCDGLGDLLAVLMLPFSLLTDLLRDN